MNDGTSACKPTRMKNRANDCERSDGRVAAVLAARTATLPTTPSAATPPQFPVRSRAPPKEPDKAGVKRPAATSRCRTVFPRVTARFPDGVWGTAQVPAISGDQFCRGSDTDGGDPQIMRRTAHL